MARIGYARVSTTDQSANLQTTALKDAGCERIYTDHGVSGTKAERPELSKMLDHLRPGDEVIVWKLDRLGRNTRNLLELVDDLTVNRDVTFRSVTEGITTDGPMGKAMLTIMSAFAQLERDQLAERTRAGMADAAASGRKAGRPEVGADNAKVQQAREYKNKGNSAAETAKLLEVSRATVYRFWKMTDDAA